MASGSAFIAPTFKPTASYLKVTEGKSSVTSTKLSGYVAVSARSPEGSMSNVNVFGCHKDSIWRKFKLRPPHGWAYWNILAGKEKLRSSPDVVSRLFGPTKFDASKLKVMFLDEIGIEQHPGKFRRVYTLTHSDVTAELTLSISQTVNKAQLQGWYRRFQRDEVLAEWRKINGFMCLHIHCHISGSHRLLDIVAQMRFSVFCKELPLVLKAFRHGDQALFRKHPDLDNAFIWVHFHSRQQELNRVECWGLLGDTANEEVAGA